MLYGFTRGVTLAAQAGDSVGTDARRLGRMHGCARDESRGQAGGRAAAPSPCAVGSRSREYFSSVFFIELFIELFIGSTLYFTAIADTAVEYGTCYWHIAMWGLRYLKVVDLKLLS